MPDERQSHSAEDASSDQPWYSEGLRFRCTQCGNCCTGGPGYVWVDDEELQCIAEHLKCSIGEVRLLHTRIARGRLSLTEYANGDCTFFDPQSRRCRVYPARPRQCRSWPFWRSNLADPETWEQTQTVCPGSTCGELVPLETIQRLADDPRL